MISLKLQSSTLQRGGCHTLLKNERRNPADFVRQGAAHLYVIPSMRRTCSGSRTYPTRSQRAGAGCQHLQKKKRAEQTTQGRESDLTGNLVDTQKGNQLEKPNPKTLQPQRHALDTSKGWPRPMFEAEGLELLEGSEGSQMPMQHNQQHPAKCTTALTAAPKAKSRSIVTASLASWHLMFLM